jgi:hypothetical protein
MKRSLSGATSGGRPSEDQIVALREKTLKEEPDPKLRAQIRKNILTPALRRAGYKQIRGAGIIKDGHVDANHAEPGDDAEPSDHEDLHRSVPLKKFLATHGGERAVRERATFAKATVTSALSSPSGHEYVLRAVDKDRTRQTLFPNRSHLGTIPLKFSLEFSFFLLESNRLAIFVCRLYGL